MEIIKADLEKQLSSMTSQKKRLETKLKSVEQKNTRIEDDMNKKD
jgi:hypothetical protein